MSEHEEENRYLREEVGLDKDEIARRRIDNDLWPFVPVEESATC